MADLSWLQRFPALGEETLRAIRLAIDGTFRTFTREHGEMIERLFDPLRDFLLASEHLHIQGIDRRVVEGDNQDIARTPGADGGYCRKAHTKLQKAKNHRSRLSVLSFGKIGLTITHFIDRVSNKFDV